MIFIPIGLAAVAVILFFVGRSKGSKALEMQSTETSTAAALATSAADVAKELGAGSFSQVAEIKGTVECATPLTSELSGTACVWFRSTVTREYEEQHTERDSEGHTRTVTRRGSENVSTNERRTRFEVRDATGVTTVDPEGAKLDGERILQRFEQGDRGPALSIGSLRIPLAALGLGRRTLGYKLEEWAIPVGRNIYVLGEARDSGGSLVVAKPAAKGGRFIVSLKSEEELVKSAKTGSSVLTIIAGVCAAGAAVLLVLVILHVI